MAGAQQPGTQAQSTVAMAPDGTYVIAWSTTPITVSNENTPPEAIYAREYSSAGAPLSNEFQVSSSSAGYAQSLPDVAMDANDDFVVVWEGDEESSQWGVYGDYFTSNGSSTSPAWSSTGPKLLNNSPNTRSSFSAMKAIDLHDTGPRVAMDLAGAFVVTWANFVNPTEGYDIFAQQFAGASATSSVFQVNDVSKTNTNIGWQVMPSVGMDDSGDYTVVWTSYGQDNAEDGQPERT